MKKSDVSSIWSFLSPISWGCVLGLAVAVLVVGSLIFVFEEKNWKRPLKEHIINYTEAVFNAFTSIYASNAMNLTTISSKIIQWTFWFHMIIFWALYQADLTDKLSSSYNESKYQLFRPFL